MESSTARKRPLTRQGYRFFRTTILVGYILAGVNDPIVISYAYPFSVIRYALISGSLALFFRAFFFEYDSLSLFLLTFFADWVIFISKY